LNWFSALFHSCTLVLLVIIAYGIFSPIQINLTWPHGLMSNKFKRMWEAAGNRAKEQLRYSRESLASYWWKHVVPLFHPYDLESLKSLAIANQATIAQQAIDVETVQQ
jgi:hypothetical protein